MPSLRSRCETLNSGYETFFKAPFVSPAVSLNRSLKAFAVIYTARSSAIPRSVSGSGLNQTNEPELVERMVEKVVEWCTTMEGKKTCAEGERGGERGVRERERERSSSLNTFRSVLA